MKKTIIGSSLFTTGTLGFVILLSNENLDRLIFLFVCLCITSVLGLVIMIIEAIGFERVKSLLTSKYDITGKSKEI